MLTDEQISKALQLDETPGIDFVRLPAGTVNLDPLAEALRNTQGREQNPSQVVLAEFDWQAIRLMGRRGAGGGGFEELWVIFFHREKMKYILAWWLSVQRVGYGSLVTELSDAAR